MVGLAPTKSLRTPDFGGGCFCCSAIHAKWNSDFKSDAQDFKSEIHLCQKIDEGRENNAANSGVPARAARVGCWQTSRHTSPEDGDVRHARKATASSSVEGSLPSSLAKRYFDCQKTKGAGFKPPREAARSFNSREFGFEIWERESAPAD